MIKLLLFSATRLYKMLACFMQGLLDERYFFKPLKTLIFSIFDIINTLPFSSRIQKALSTVQDYSSTERFKTNLHVEFIILHSNIFLKKKEPN